MSLRLALIHESTGPTTVWEDNTEHTGPWTWSAHLWHLKETGCPSVLFAELWVTLFVMESCRGRPPVDPSFYSKNHILLLAWVTLADTCLELEKHLHWLWVLRRDIDFPGLVMTVSLASAI